MHLNLLRLTLALGLACAPVVGAQTAPNDAAPGRGRTMADVRERLGAPAQTHAAVGNPPITRWDYPGLIVVFEHDRVIDSVRPLAPPTIYHRDELMQRSVSNAGGQTVLK